MPHPEERLSSALADRYRIERELGQGGMAMVYLAEDLRHSRHVALKVLRPELAAVIGASRFLAEIKTTANLQHPHILALHDSGEVEGTVYYVMPYVDGETLRDRLDKEKQLPVEEAVRIAVEVAGALEYAHQHKVIHRDIKPENVLLQGGHALVADFGIALAAARTEGGTRMTETGMSLGTPQYMSPEQAMGEREITAKSDVYALGCVLYEMLTGEPPFTGPTAQAIVARVMTEEPRSLTLQRRTIPRHVEAAIQRALSKLPADRFASAAQFAEALLNPSALPAETAAFSGVAASTRPGSRRVLAVLGVGGLVVAAGAFLLGRRTAPTPATQVMRFSMPLPDSLTAGRCCGDGLALSPDGRTLVFTMNGATGSLFRRSIDRLEAEPIPGTEGGSVPFFSPDGRWVGFAADGKLRKVSLAGGPPIPIATAEAVDEASWSEQDQIIFADNAGLLTVSASGGEPQRLLGPDSLQFVYAPTFLPGGQAALFVTRPRGSGLDAARIAVIDLKNRKVDTLGPGTQVRYANGYLVFGGADNTLLAQPFDPGRRKLTGQAVAILDRVTLHGGRTHEFALSQSGTLVYQPSAVAGTGEQIVLAGPSGKAPITLPGRVAGDLEDPTFSPDGHKILLRIATGSAGTGDLWLLDRQQGTLERFTVGGATWPAWSRDGRRVAYQGSDGGGGIYIKNADGTGEPRLILKGGNLAPGSWLPGDRGLVIFGAGRPQTRGDIGMIALGDTTPRWLLETEFRELHPQVSPDGRWLAFSSNRTGSFEVYVQPLDGNGPQVQVSTEGGQSPRWSPDGRTLYYAANQQTIMAAARAPGLGFAVASRKTVLEAGYMDFNNTNVNWDVSPDGKQFLYIEQAAGGSAHFTWVMNWPQLVKEMTGAQK